MDARSAVLRSAACRATKLRSAVEILERRLCLSAVNVTTHHGDAMNDGANLSEAVLTPANVNPTDFGKQLTAQLDGGVVTAQPTYLENVNITTGSNQGIHSVVYAETEVDGLYAIDANNGTVLWHDSFLNVTDPTNLTPTTGVGPIRSTDINGNTDVGNNVGIVATPAFDTSVNEMFVTTNTREVRGADTHFVQRLWAINCSSGAAVNSTVIADTIADGGILGDFTYVSGPIISGTGNNDPANPNDPTYPNTDRWLSAPNGDTGSVIAFNAILQMERPAITLLNGSLYLAFASHGDDGPYYGWVLGYGESTLALNAVFNAIPTFSTNVDSSQPYIAEAGIWMSGSNIATDGTYLYVTTGNGAFNGSAGNFNSSGFPIDHDYGDSLLKLAVDPSSSPTNQNGNGWGLKVADYFTPSNQYELNALDLDLGSGGVTLLPNTILDAAGNPELIFGGKESRIYLLDRNNLGKFNPNYPQGSSADPRLYDNVLGEYVYTGGVNVGGKQVYSSGTYLNGNVYFGLDGAPGLEFSVANFASGTVPPGSSYVPPVTKTAVSLGYPGATWQATANNTSNGIIWGINPGGTDLLAYNASSFVNPIYDSNTNPADNITGGSVKFSLPLVVNGMAYLGTNNGTLIGYGLKSTYLTSSTFGAPSNPVVTTVSNTDAHLSWTSYSPAASEFAVLRSTGSGTFSTIAYVPNPGTSAVTYDDTTVTPYTRYVYEIEAISGSNATAASSGFIYTAPLVLNGRQFYVSGNAGALNVFNNPTGAGTPDVSVNPSNILQLVINGPTADDSLTVNFTGGDPLPQLGLTFNGFGGNDALTLVGGGDTFTVGVSWVPVAAGGETSAISYAGIASVAIDGGLGANTITQTSAPAVPTTVINTNSADSLNVASGSFTLNAPAAGATSAAVNLGTLTIAGGSTVSFAPAADHAARGVLNLGTLNLAGSPGNYTARLDLTSNDLVLTGPSLANVSSAVAQGYNLTGGAVWTGDGITSSTAAGDPLHLMALGTLVNNDGAGHALFGATTASGTFDGLNPAATAVLVRFTSYGDANLDGKIDGSDYSLLDAAYSTDLPNNGKSPVTGWYGGDFNYDGYVDGSDYALIDNAYNNIPTEAGAQLAITTGAQSLTGGAPSAAITVRLQNRFGVAVPAPAGGTVVSLSTTSANGVFQNSSGAVVTSVLIPAGASAAAFTYADSNAGLPVVTASGTGLTSASQSLRVFLGNYDYQVGLYSSTGSVTVGTPGALTVQLKTDQGGAYIAPAGGVTVSLATTSATGSFSNSASGSPVVTSVVVPAGSSSVTVYYSDTTGPYQTLTASTSGAGSALLQLPVNDTPAAVVITTPARSLNPGIASAPITIGLVDGVGNAVNSPSGTTITLSNSSGGGTFLNSSFGVITSVTIPAGSSSVTIEYKNSTVGTPTITASASGLTTATQQETVDPAYALPTGTVAFYSFENPQNLYADTSGRGNNLALAGGSVVFDAGAAPGHSGSALFSNNGSLQTSSGAFPTAVPTGSSAYTIAAWIDISTINVGGIVGWGNWGTNNQVNAFRTSVRNDGPPDGTGLDNYWWGNDQIDTTPNILLDNWAYVAVTSTGTGSQTIYFDGVAIGTDNRTGQATTGTNFRVGTTNNASEFFTGRMSDLLIANVAFSQTQIQTLYGQG